MSFSTESQTASARLRDELKGGTRIISLSGLTSIAAKAFVLSELQAQNQKTFRRRRRHEQGTRKWCCDLDFFSIENSESEIQKSKRCHHLNPTFIRAFSPHAETQEERALTLWRFDETARRIF